MAQRKKRIHQDFMLKLLLVVIGICSIISFMDGSFVLQYCFQFYLITMFMTFFALYNRFFLYSFLSCLLMLLNFFVVSSSAPLFLRGEDISKGHELKLAYQTQASTFLDIMELAEKEHPELMAALNFQNLSGDVLKPTINGYNLLGEYSKDSLMMTDQKADMVGYITLGKNNHAVFSSLKLKEKDYVFLSLDLSSATYKEQKKAFKYLSNFVSAQDEPVIIFGNFGLPAWSVPFRRFLEENGLEVKNPLFSSLANLFKIPTDYVIGYRNLYFEDCRVLHGHNQDQPVTLFELKI